MSVTLSEVRRAARAHRAPLAGESVGYLVLAIADQVLQAPRLVQAADVQLTEDGALRVVSGHASSDADAELSLRRALDQLLLVASSGSAALTRASRRTAPLGLSSLVRELEAALIPVNRSAARRALARVHRETARALESGSLPEDDEAQEPAPAMPPAIAAPVVPPAVPPAVELCEPNQKTELESELDQDLETPALVAAVLPVIPETQLDGVVSALCEQLPASPQFVESDALTSALAVRTVSAPVSAPAAEPEPEFLLEIDVEFDTDAVDSSAAPTVMRAVELGPVALSAHDVPSEQTQLDLPVEARTRPEPVVLRKTLRPLLDLLPKPIADSEPLPQTPTLGTLATQLPILAPEQIAEMSVAASLAAELLESSRRSEDRTERMPEVLPLSPGVAMVESKKSDVTELLNSFQVAEPSASAGLCRAIKEMADLDLTPAPFAALIR
ncbi:MAG: hypothetical protein WDO69_21360 [Pseudomonadota bacterium]